MSQEEFEAAIARLLEDTVVAEKKAQGGKKKEIRAYRRRMKNLKDTKLFNQLVNAGYTYRAKWPSAYTYEGDQGDGMFRRRQAWVIQNIRGTGLYIRGVGSRRRRFFKRLSARSFRRKFRKWGEIADGNMAKRVALDMAWELV